MTRTRYRVPRLPVQCSAFSMHAPPCPAPLLSSRLVPLMISIFYICSLSARFKLCPFEEMPESTCPLWLVPALAFFLGQPGTSPTYLPAPSSQ